MEARFSTFKKISGIIFDFFFPDQCVLCGTIGMHLCDDCRMSLPSAPPHPAPWIYSRFHYQDPTVASLIQRMKTFPDRKLAHLFALSLRDLTLEALSDEALFGNTARILITPIPIGYARWRERGYNQASLIAQELASLIPEITFTDIVRKKKTTAKQALLHAKKDRLHNMKGAFSIKEQVPLAGHTVVIVDDVTTTGATLADAKRALRAHGARAVIAVTVAH